MRTHTPSAQHALVIVELDVTDPTLGGIALTAHGRLRTEVTNQLVAGYAEAESRPHVRRIGPPTDRLRRRPRLHPDPPRVRHRSQILVGSN
ncbi:hypothetical protein MMAGJ_55890 [Mycolicibacterium mageritense]|uniref:Uncharacterized protein n=1 Tax=Mycolicibacterium mageritense TaxID=53462 RepID=A0ABN5YDX4_MYCME|nr:hypothetical protein MMAGJ_55890 [Mycolicibacterium mageritense]